MTTNFDDFDTQLSMEEFDSTVKAADYKFVGFDGPAQYTPIEIAEINAIYRLKEKETESEIF